MPQLKILHAFGARPNFVKAAPLINAFSDMPSSILQKTLHTGQHYNRLLSDSMLNDLGVLKVDYLLNAGKSSATRQIADIILSAEPVLEEFQPDKVIVYGDVNSTVAMALVAAKMNIDVVHVEAGLRSYDRTMPEEINRLVTDQLSSLLLTPSVDASTNLSKEGFGNERIKLVGNIMIDSLVKFLPQATERFEILKNILRVDKNYVLVTLHRPSNVDNNERLREIFMALVQMSKENIIIFPVHPRTRMRLELLKLNGSKNLKLIDPLPYIDFISLIKSAELVLTDSGGVQEETSFLGVKCLTLRANTERPITVLEGTNRLLTPDENIIEVATEVLKSKLNADQKKIPLWDGKTSKRIVDFFLNEYVCN